MCRQLYQMTSVVLDVSSVVPYDISGVSYAVSCTRWGKREKGGGGGGLVEG